ncbi:hypothetical protein CSUI_004481, partial [Cystoisospora suis]
MMANIRNPPFSYFSTSPSSSSFISPRPSSSFAFLFFSLTLHLLLDHPNHIAARQILLSSSSSSSPPTAFVHITPRVYSSVSSSSSSSLLDSNLSPSSLSSSRHQRNERGRNSHVEVFSSSL